MQRCKQCALIILVTPFLLPPVNANQDLDFTAQLTNATCQVELNNGGLVYFDTVTPGYFTGQVDAQTDYHGGKNFSLTLVSCPVNEASLSSVNISFVPKSGQMAVSNNAIFDNEWVATPDKASNVGVVIFTNPDDGSPRKNVLNAQGQNQVVYSGPSYFNKTWAFYSRLQRISAASGVTSGHVSSQVLVSVSYQ